MKNLAVASRQIIKGAAVTTRAKTKCPKWFYKMRAESNKCRYHGIPAEVCGCLC